MNFEVFLTEVLIDPMGVVDATYPHHGQESVQQVHRQDKRLRAVTKEAGQAPQVLHFGISALG